MTAIVNSQSEFKSVTEILENIYPEILQDMKDDDYIIQYENYESFFEIEYEGDIAGFYTMEESEERNVLNEIYVLRKFRGRNIASRKIMDLLVMPNINLFIRNPNQNMIQTLLSHDLAISLPNNLIFSGVGLVVSSSEIYKNSKIKKAYRNIDYDMFFSASYYDNDLKCIITTNESPFFKREGTLAVIEPRKTDLKKYNLRKKLKRTTLKSLNDKLMYIFDSLDEVNEFKEEEYDRIIALNSIDTLISDDTIDNLSKTWNIDKKDLKEIHDVVKKSVEDGEVDERFTRTRMNYLLENPSMINRKADMKLLPDYCPFCENIVSDDYMHCPVCAFSFVGLSSDDVNIDGDNNLYREVVEKAEENNWNLDEILDIQCLCGTYEFIMMSRDIRVFPIDEVDRSNKVRNGSVAEFGLKNGYLKKCTYDEYIDIVENEFTMKDLELEAMYYGLEKKHGRNEITRAIKDNVSAEDIHIKYLETEKGGNLYENSEILEFYMKYLRTFLFCEFKKFYDEHDYPLNEAGDRFIEMEYEKGIEKKNWRVYKQMLKYEMEKIYTPREHFKLAVQMLIYDINCDDLRDDLNMGCEMDTLTYFRRYLPSVGDDRFELFDEAYDEFRLDELKGNYDEAFDTFIDICGRLF